jgi:GxxExxY protein
VTTNELTHAIIGAAIRVQQTLGPGLLESAYRICLAYELQKVSLEVILEKPIPVVYESVKLECGFRADLLVAGQVIVECKAKEKLHPVDKAQPISAGHRDYGCGPAAPDAALDSPESEHQ